MKEALGWINNNHRGRYMACANPHSLVVASRDSEFQGALKEADILIPDGVGIVLAAKTMMNTPNNRSKLDVPFIGSIGAVFDFYAGTKVRSSTFWHRLCVEWLRGFLREPWRVWERNMKSIPIFLAGLSGKRCAVYFLLNKREKLSGIAR